MYRTLYLATSLVVTVRNEPHLERRYLRQEGTGPPQAQTTAYVIKKYLSSVFLVPCFLLSPIPSMLARRAGCLRIVRLPARTLSSVSTPCPSTLLAARSSVISGQSAAKTIANATKWRNIHSTSTVLGKRLCFFVLESREECFDDAHGSHIRYIPTTSICLPEYPIDTKYFMLQALKPSKSQMSPNPSQRGR
jgi:hypothetical protein